MTDLLTRLTRGWFAELRRPSLKCERVGHSCCVEWRKGYVPSEGGYFGGVAAHVRQERTICRRCAAMLAPWATVQSQSLHGLSAPSDGWERIEAGGWWIEHGRGALDPVTTPDA